MKNFNFLFRSSLTIILMIFTSITSLNAEDYNSARLSILYGSTIPFNFNTIQKIKDGIEIKDGTKFGITLTNLGVGGTLLKGFVLQFQTFNGQDKIKGDVHELDLDMIRVKAENALGLESGNPSDPLYQNLSSSPVILFTYTKEPWVPLTDDLHWNTHQLNISYECGKEAGKSLLGKNSDNYAVEIEFELIPFGDGF